MRPLLMSKEIKKLPAILSETPLQNDTKSRRPLVIVGSDTNVGKTLIAYLATEALQGFYWKPIQCGIPSDRSWVKERLSYPQNALRETVCLTAPLSPHLAARKERKKISAQDFPLPPCKGPLIIEGTGGILTPLNETEQWLDAAIPWNAKWILIYRPYLGSFNHFFLT